MSGHYVAVSALPDCLQSALRSVGYGRVDISLEARETYQAAGASGQGKRRFVMAVNLATGERETHCGSWGGANMFNPGNAVDLDTASRPIAPGFAIIEGSQGEKTYASIGLHPSNVVAYLPEKRQLTARQSYLVSAFASLNPRGRKEQFERGAYHDPRHYSGEYGPRLGHAPSEAELAELAAMGLIKVNRAGAVTITTEGRNASNRRGFQ